MATIESLKKQTLDLMHTIQDISAATSVLNWDQETYMPSGASAMRAEQISTLSTLAHQLLTGDKAKSLLLNIPGALIPHHSFLRNLSPLNIL